jgi:hypothetical protein
MFIEQDKKKSMKFVVKEDKSVNFSSYMRNKNIKHSSEINNSVKKFLFYTYFQQNLFNKLIQQLKLLLAMTPKTQTYFLIIRTQTIMRISF